ENRIFTPAKSLHGGCQANGALRQTFEGETGVQRTRGRTGWHVRMTRMTARPFPRLQLELALPHFGKRQLDVLHCRAARDLSEAQQLIGLCLATRDQDRARSAGS